MPDEALVRTIFYSSGTIGGVRHADSLVRSVGPLT
jgi:hypothetical protein